MSNDSVGQKVKALRENAKLSQMQIALFLEVDQSTISKCEKGERQFQIDHLERLSSLFGLSLEDLMKADVSGLRLQIAFRANGIEVEDLNAIADIQKIALNLEQMCTLLRERVHEA